MSFYEYFTFYNHILISPSGHRSLALNKLTAKKKPFGH